MPSHNQLLASNTELIVRKKSRPQTNCWGGERQLRPAPGRKIPFTRRRVPAIALSVDSMVVKGLGFRPGAVVKTCRTVTSSGP